VHCSITDLARYAGWHAEEGTTTRWKANLKPETFARLHTAPSGGDYACGWGVLSRGWAGGRVLTHNGSNTMWYAVMWVAPLKKAAFVAATNAATKGAQPATDAAVSELVTRLVKSA
jgi:CubicO group peptidase (beta-lactamase class C family)